MASPNKILDPRTAPLLLHRSHNPRNLHESIAMASRLVAAAAASSSSPLARLISRRGLAGAADPHATPKVNIWQDPLSPSKWKEEHFVLASLSMWGGLIFGGYKMFSGGKKENKTGEAPAHA